jgi:hypothetical protein
VTAETNFFQTVRKQIIPQGRSNNPTGSPGIYLKSFIKLWHHGLTSLKDFAMTGKTKYQRLPLILVKLRYSEMMEYKNRATNSYGQQRPRSHKFCQIVRPWNVYDAYRFYFEMASECYSKHDLDKMLYDTFSGSVSERQTDTSPPAFFMRYCFL